MSLSPRSHSIMDCVPAPQITEKLIRQHVDAPRGKRASLDLYELHEVISTVNLLPGQGRVRASGTRREYLHVARRRRPWRRRSRRPAPDPPSGRFSRGTALVTLHEERRRGQPSRPRRTLTVAASRHDLRCPARPRSQIVVGRQGEPRPAGFYVVSRMCRPQNPQLEIRQDP